jgi:membrane protein
MTFLRLLGAAARHWYKRGADQHAAALAYFTPFALTPLIIFSITIVGFIMGSERVISMLLRWGNNIDPGITELLYNSVQNFGSLESHYIIPVFGVLFLSLMIIVALSSFASALHHVWGVEAEGWNNALRRLGRILLVILVLQVYLVFIIIVEDTLSYFMWSEHIWWQLLESAVTFFCSVTLLALIYGFVTLSSPSFDARFVGALVASVLLLGTRYLVAFHFATAPVQSLFGAAGLLLTLLVWVYIASGLLLFGAAFAFVYAQQRTAQELVLK